MSEQQFREDLKRARDMDALNASLDALIEWPHLVSMSAIEVVDLERVEAAIKTLEKLRAMKARLEP